MHIAKIDNLMPATCAGCDNYIGTLGVDLAKEIGSSPNEQIVFLGERAECSRHSAASSVEQFRFSSWQPLYQPFHKRRIHQRLGVAMRVYYDVHLSVLLIFEPQGIRLARE